jgi:hypothetical protein
LWTAAWVTSALLLFAAFVVWLVVALGCGGDGGVPCAAAASARWLETHPDCRHY